MTLTDPAQTRIRDGALTAVDLAATFVLAAECALTGVQADFDLFGILVLAFVGSVGGAVIRDLLLGEHPPAPLRDWRYAALAVAATTVVIAASLAFGRVADFTPPIWIDVFEAVGLALAAVAGARKSLDYNLNGASVVVIATVNGCGGGILRDVLGARVPHVLHEDFYATAALAGAALMVVLMNRFGVRKDMAGTIAGVAIFALRTAALLGEWRLPHLR
ncbi:trimeric intracellular cation channel family protein [Novosphingobium sp. AP12]|uniref:trimeric intracellular cation channel family protein n=1 Tax=Novosphingobium sp. AP12 TaxID=1144305 RepID=UPI000271EBFA|nr:TRIC cation channel family protein [Novosphingobium sp. AP12]EJL35323.1 putative membrane protein [Novosphingobium sp. AP12]